MDFMNVKPEGIPGGRHRNFVEDQMNAAESQASPQRKMARIGRIFGNKNLYHRSKHLPSIGISHRRSCLEQLKRDLSMFSCQVLKKRRHVPMTAVIKYRGVNAVTNFGLSTYIRWLEPGTSTHAAALEQQATRPTAEPEIVLENAGFNLRGEPLHHPQIIISSLRMNYLDPKDDAIVQKQPFNLNNKSSSSSPTALRLLFRSSVFRELMQKNTVVQEDDTNTDEAKNTINFSLDDEYLGILYDGTTGNCEFQYMCSPGDDKIELHEEDPQFAL